jgi:hypothetical protein
MYNLCSVDLQRYAHCGNGVGNGIFELLFSKPCTTDQSVDVVVFCLQAYETGKACISMPHVCRESAVSVCWT